MKINPDTTVGEIAVESSEFIALFEARGIDYCCGGGRSLRQACYLAGVPLDQVTADIEKIFLGLREKPGEKDWRCESIAALIDHLLKTHHAFTREQIRRIDSIFETILAAPTGAPPEVPTLQSLFQALSRELEDHMRHEEEVVFPYLLEVEQARLKGKTPPQPFSGYDGFTHPLYTLASEHGLTGSEWKEIELLTDHFQAPAHGAQALLPLYAALAALEEDNRKHIHLENNILLKKAAEWGLLKTGGPA